MALGWLAIATVVTLSLIHAPTAVDLGGGRDKVFHFAGYFCLAAWFGQLYVSWRARMLCAVGFIGLGLALEWLQGTTTWRSADALDAVANISGVVVATALLATPLQHALLAVDRWLARLRSN